MESMFGDYPTIKDADDVIDDKDTETVTESKKICERLKKLIKQIKRQNKLLRQINRQIRQEKNSEHLEEPVVKKSNEIKNESKKTFWNKLCDVFLKTLPSILRTVVPIAITSLLGCTSHAGRSKRSAIA